MSSHFHKIVKSVSNIEEICKEFSGCWLVFIKGSIDSKTNTGRYYCVIYLHGIALTITDTVRAFSLDQLLLEALYEASSHFIDGRDIALITSRDLGIVEKIASSDTNDYIVNSIIENIKDTGASFYEYYLNKNETQLDQFISRYFKNEEKDILVSDVFEDFFDNDDITSINYEAKRIIGTEKSFVNDSIIKKDTDCFINLQDKNAAIQFIQSTGYFPLLSGIYGNDSFITYKIFVDYQDVYLKDVFSAVFDTLTGEEFNILKKRYGIGNEPKQSLDIIAKTYNCSSSRIHQIEQKTLRKLRVPSRFKTLSGIIFDYESRQWDDSCLDVSNELENLVKKELKLVFDNKLKRFHDIKNRYSNLCFKNILYSPWIRGFFDDNYINTYSPNTSKYNLPYRAKCYLNRILESDELYSLKYDDLVRNQLFEKEVVDQIIKIIERTKEFKDKVTNLTKKYNSPVDFINDNCDKLITRIKAPISYKIQLLQRGFLFVNDFLELYDEIDYLTRSSEAEQPFLVKEANGIKGLLSYTPLLLYIKIPKTITSKILNLKISSFSDFERNMDQFPHNMRKAVNEIYNTIENAYKRAPQPKKYSFL